MSSFSWFYFQQSHKIWKLNWIRFRFESKWASGNDNHLYIFIFHRRVADQRCPIDCNGLWWFRFSFHSFSVVFFFWRNFKRGTTVWPFRRLIIIISKSLYFPFLFDGVFCSSFLRHRFIPFQGIQRDALAKIFKCQTRKNVAIINQERFVAFFLFLCCHSS